MWHADSYQIKLFKSFPKVGVPFYKSSLLLLSVPVLICVFLVKLSLGELKVGETAYRKQEAESPSSGDHHPDNQSTSHRTNHFLVRLSPYFNKSVPVA